MTNQSMVFQCIKILAIAVLVWVAGMQGLDALSAPGTPPDGQEIVLIEQDTGRTVELNADQVLVISLESIPGTGYVWQEVQIDDSVLRRHLTAQPDYELTSTGTGAGAERRQLLRFLGTNRGETDLRLEYRRSWELSAAAEKVFSIHIRTVGEFVGRSMPTPTMVAPVPAPTQAEVEDPEAEDQTNALPSAYDWCALGGCTPVRDQRSCGSCWAFATAGVLESAIKLEDSVSRDISEQYLVSCNTDGWGCSGGWWAHDYHLNKTPPGESVAGAVYESEFPYVAADVACNAPHSHHERLASWTYVDPFVAIPSVAAIKQAIYNHGPVAVGICAGSNFSNYAGGVLTVSDSAECGWDAIDHAVVLVGWNDTDGAWILRNSWGVNWGEAGYMRITYGISNVGYGANYISYDGTAPDPTPLPTSIPPFNVASSIYLPLVLTGATSENVVNGGFENGTQGWQEHSLHGYGLILPSNELPIRPYHGEWAAWLGGLNDEISYVEQVVTVPPDASVLRYWHWILSGDSCGYDYGGVLVRQGENLSVVDVYDLCTLTQTGGWQAHSVDLSAYAGETIGVQIRVETDDTYISSVLVDEVSFGGVLTGWVLPAVDTLTGEAPIKPAVVGSLDSSANGVAVDDRIFTRPGSAPAK